MAGESDILVRLRLKGEEFSAGVKDAFSGVGDEAERAGEDAGSRMAKGFSAKYAAFAAAGAAAFTLLVKAVNDSVELGANIATSAQQIGIGTEALQEYQYVAEQVGVSQNELEGTLQKLTLTIGEAADGNKKFTEGFSELGVSLTDAEGRGRTTDQVFQDIIKTLGAIEDPSERARIGTQLLGEEYQKMEPILALGADGVSELTDRLHDMNGVLSEEEIKNLQDTNAKLDEMQRILSVNIAGAVAGNAEGILFLADALGTLAAKSIEAAAEFATAIKTFANEPLFSVISRDQDPAFGSKFLGPYGSLTEFAGSVRAGARRPKANQDPESPGYNRPINPPKSRGGGGGRKPGKSAEQREQERAAKALQKEYERLEESLDRQVETLEDAAAIEEIRRTKGEYAAEVAKKHLDIERQFPTLIGQSAEAVAERYRITVAEGQQLLDNLELTKQMAEQASLDKWYDLQETNFNESVAEAEKQILESQKRLAEKQRRIQEEQLLDISDFYFDLFSGNTGNIWKDFKRQGLGVISDIAAKWTLALITGQDTSLGNIAGNVLGGPFPGGGSPLGSLFGAISGGGLFGGGAANDNGAPGGMWDPASIALGKDGLLSGSPLQSGGSGGLGGLGGGLPGAAGLYAGAVAISDTIGQGISSLLGLKYSKTAGGIFGALGGIIGGLFKKRPAGQAGVTSLDEAAGISTNKSEVRDNLGGITGQLQDNLRAIAKALGAETGAFSVSIGQREDYFRVAGSAGTDTGRKNTSGFLYDGKDPEEALRIATLDALRDGVLKGISDASQRILQSGQDLETALEKALMIEELPKLLQQRLDPVGYALDQINDKFERLAEVLREGGASAEQIAQAQQLWELEKADAIAAVGGASDTLKDFLLSLNAGSGSPLSLRQQQQEAEAALAPYIAQIREAEAAKAELDRLKQSGASTSDIAAAETAARIASQKIDQSGFQDSGSLLLNISRQIDASGSGFFTQFDRIRDLTNSAISLIDNAVPISADNRDPFTEATANILTDHTDILNNINTNIARLVAGGGGNGSFGPRNYTDLK